LSGLWALRIENLKHKVIATMSIRFADEANSCMAGTWKRVIVAGQTSSEKDFFPIADPLSYEVTKIAVPSTSRPAEFPREIAHR
jgi:hypothetical protein